MSMQKEVRKKVEPLGSVLDVRSQLGLLGWRSVVVWAKAHGYAPVTVRAVLRRWSKADIEPLGGIGRQIMREVRDTLTNKIKM